MDTAVTVPQLWGDRAQMLEGQKILSWRCSLPPNTVRELMHSLCEPEKQASFKLYSSPKTQQSLKAWVPWSLNVGLPSTMSGGLGASGLVSSS